MGHTLSLGPYYFTRLLIPQLEAAGSSRVVTLTSHGHVLVNGINWDTIMDGPERRNAKPLDLYNQSKFVSDSRFVSFLPFDEGSA